MNISALLVEAGLLMLVGMVVVFLFLSMLIIAIKLLAKFAEAYPDPAPITPKAPTISNQSTQDSPQVIAAISAAIKQYKSRNK